MGSDLFKVEIIGNIARCSMNSPGNMNALNTEMGYPMVEAMGDVLADDSVRVIILRGEGGHFCSGADLDLLGEEVDPLFLNQAMRRHSGTAVCSSSIQGIVKSHYKNGKTIQIPNTVTDII